MSLYLVTGATGFLGRYVVDHLARRGHTVRALVRSGISSNRARGSASIQAEIVNGDVLDREQVEVAARGCDGAFHLAGKVSRKPEDAEELFRVHVEGTKSVLDGCRAAGIGRVVVASTSGVVCVGDDPKEIRDERADAPVDLIARWPYYRSKLYAEKAALDRNGPGFEVVCVNPTLLLGPGDERESSTTDVVKFLEGKVPFVPGGGLSFVDARDAAEAFVLAMEKGKAGERYLVSAANMTIEAFFHRLERISGVRAPRLRAPRSPGLARFGADLLERVAKRVNVESPIDRISADMASYFWYVDASKAKRELGWLPRDPGETLADTVDDLTARGVVWPRVD